MNPARPQLDGFLLFKHKLKTSKREREREQKRERERERERERDREREIINCLQELCKGKLPEQC